MKTSRKQFLHQCTMAFAGTTLPYHKLLASISNAPPPFVKDTFHPKDCTFDHRGYFYATNQIDTQDDVSYAKASMNHKDVMYEADPGEGNCDPSVNSCGYYGYDGENSLRYKVYFPKKSLHDYDTVPLPAIILFHPGGFGECADYQQGLMVTLAKEFSRRGFITFNVEYRRGKLEDGANTSVQDMLATYRGQQDARGVIRSIVKKQLDDIANSNSWDYLINLEQIFVGGASAGGVMALSCAYYRGQSMVDSVNPHDAVSLAISNSNILGPQNADYYHGDVNTTYWPHIAGTLNMWGGLPIPKSNDINEASFFYINDAHANPPMIAFHGVLDSVVDFPDDPTQDVKFSLPTFPQNYNSESSCLNNGSATYTIEGTTAGTGIVVRRCSSLNMYNVLKTLNRYTELYYDCDMSHGLSSTSEFGIGTHDAAEVTKYIAQRTAVFFQTIMNYGSVPVPFGLTGRSVFRDCRNNRNSCSMATDAGSCINDSASYEACPVTE